MNVQTIAEMSAYAAALRTRTRFPFVKTVPPNIPLSRWCPGKAVVRARKGALDNSRIVVEDDLIHRSLYLVRRIPRLRAAKAYICPHSDEVNANENDEDIHNGSDPTSPAADLVEVGAIVHSPHPEVGNAPEDPTKEGIEQRTHQSQ